MNPNMMCIRTLVATTAAALVLQSCAAPGDGTAPTPEDVFAGDCNPLVAGAIGTAVGALLAGGSNRVRGAAIGAGVGALACMAYNYSTRQTKSSQQVTDEYKDAHRGALPVASRVTRFNAQVAPKASVQAGSAIDVASQIEVVPGAKDPRPKVEQQIALYGPDGKEAAKARKPATEKPGGGAFETNFRFTMPQGVPQGVYPVKSQVFVNGDPAANTETRFQVVVGTSGTILATAPLREVVKQ
jgi:hypothetical protein